MIMVYIPFDNICEYNNVIFLKINSECRKFWNENKPLILQMMNTFCLEFITKYMTKYSHYSATIYSESQIFLDPGLEKH